jgi:FKBP-type peptidyl-prolyl cis-trans isomerase FkpA
MRRLWLYSFPIIIVISCQTSDKIIPFDDQLKADLGVIDNYLLTNGIVAEKDSSQNLRYSISKTGSGRKPVLVDSVWIRFSYSSIAPDRIALIDSTADKPLSFLLNSLIVGCKKIFPLMKEGSVFTIYVPSGLAYGSYQQGKVSANTNLVFKVELVKVIPEFSRQLEKDIKTIDSYLKTNNISAQKDGSGLRFLILNTGAGAVATSTDSVSLTYTGNFFDQSVFDAQTTVTKYSMAKILKGWQVGLLQLQKGGSIRIFVPSGLAYGAYGSTRTKVPVPPATNVIFDLNLIDIKKN